MFTTRTRWTLLFSLALLDAVLSSTAWAQATGTIAGVVSINRVP